MNDPVQVNESFIKFRMQRKDWIPVDHDLNLDEEVKIMIIGQVANVEYETNNDGTANRVFVIKGLIAEKI